MVSAAKNTVQLESAEAVTRAARKEKEKQHWAKKANHDPLHDFEIYVCCWCMCVKCWVKYPGGMGRCVCSQCPCARGVYVPSLTMSAMLKRRGM